MISIESSPILQSCIELWASEGGDSNTGIIECLGCAPKYQFGIQECISISVSL